MDSQNADQQTLLPKPPGTDEDSGKRYLRYGFVGLCAVTVLISFIISIVQAASSGQDAGMFAMMGLCLIGFVALEILLIVFIRREELPQSKRWFLYFFGGCIIFEAIFNIVLVFQK